ncbi:hypothetical protein [Streptomyces decoyicus]
MTNAQLSETSGASLDALVTATRKTMPPGTPDHFNLVSRVDVRDDLPQVSVPTLVVELPGAGHILSEPDRATWLRHVRKFLTTVEPHPA